MSNSVGQINLDLGINTKGFKNQLNGIQKQGSGLAGTFGKLGKVVAGAFAVKSVVNFAKSCLELGSDLQEVQNVVNVTFESMSGKVDEFAKGAMESIGLSEKVAKDYMSTFGAMSKSHGFATEAAYEQAEALTTLTGDLASFRNISTDEAFTKLSAVYTGETEALKHLGVVMTQTALDEFAMAQGMGKTTKQMTEQEKVSLRLAFVTDRLSAASGDFARTSGSWANQTRVLGLRFDALKASIGQGLINVLTPVIQLLNKLMAKLQVAADAFAKFTTAIFGDAGGSGASTFVAAEESAGGIAEGVDSAAGFAAKLKKQLMGFDKLNILSSSDSGSEGSGGGSAGSTAPSSSAPGEAATAAKGAVGALDTLKKRLEEVAAWTGFDKLWANLKKGIDKIDFSAIKTNFVNIFNGLLPIAVSVVGGIGEVMRGLSDHVGTVLGGMASVAGKQIEIASGGVARFLQAEGGKISTWVTNTASKISTGFNYLSFSAEAIFSSFWAALDTNQLAIETSIQNVLTSLSTMGMTVGTVFTDMWFGITEGFAAWTAENQPLIDEFFNGIIELGTNFSNTISGIVGDLFGSLLEWWNTSGKEIWDGIVTCVGDIMGWVTTLWNNCLQPIIDNLINEVKRLWDNSLKPLWDKILDFISSVWGVIEPIWNNLLKPLVDWIVKTVGPMIKNIINSIGAWFSDLFAMIGDTLGGFMDACGGLLDFIGGVFTGDWEKAWNGIKKFFQGIWDGIWGIVKGCINMIIDGINMLWSGLYGCIAGIVNGLGAAVGWISGIFGLDWGWEIPSDPPLIPRLATGGYVAANTPQLAVIGDNRHEGEIVAPESKIAEAVARGFAMVLSKMQQGGGVQGGSKTPVIIKIGETDFWRGFIDFHNSEVARTGESPLLI